MEWQRHFERGACDGSREVISVVMPKTQLWSNCNAHDAMEWQRHFERRATPQMGRIGWLSW